jgi:integrase
VVDALRGFRRGKPEHLVFCSVRDPLRPYAIGQAWAAALQAARVERFRFHDLRHSFASALAQSGASLIEIADAMRHRTMAMVRRYAHMSAKSRAALVNRVMGDVR